MSEGNLLGGSPGDPAAERFETLLASGAFRLERIVSRGQATPPGQWLAQERNEGVLLLSGEATLRLAEGGAPRRLRPGDYLSLPAGCRHRVEWTAPDMVTVWLALHYE